MAKRVRDEAERAPPNRLLALLPELQMQIATRLDDLRSLQSLLRLLFTEACVAYAEIDAAPTNEKQAALLDGAAAVLREKAPLAGGWLAIQLFGVHELSCGADRGATRMTARSALTRIVQRATLPHVEVRAFTQCPLCDDCGCAPALDVRDFTLCVACHDELDESVYTRQLPADWRPYAWLGHGMVRRLFCTRAGHGRDVGGVRDAPRDSHPSRAFHTLLPAVGLAAARALPFRRPLRHAVPG